MKRLAYCFVVVTLWTMPITDCIPILPPIDEVKKFIFVVHPNIANSKRNEYSDQQNEERKVPGIPSEDPLCDDSNVIDKFTSKFTDGILLEGLSELYATSLPPEEAEEAYYRIIHNAVDNVQASSPRDVSQIVSDAIRDTFGHLTTKGHIQSYGHTVGAYMKSKKVLTCENLNELVDAYVSYNKQSAENVPYNRDKGPACIQAISNGLVHFMYSLGLYTAGTVRSIYKDYADFLYHITDHQSSPQLAPTRVTITGDVLGEENYILEQIRFNWGSGTLTGTLTIEL